LIYLWFDIGSRVKLLQEVPKALENTSSKLQADIQEKRNTLYHRIVQWREVQLAYMPSVALLIVKAGSMALGTSDDVLDTEPPETIPLYLPSSLSLHQRDSPLLSSLGDKEFRLREAQANEALDDIRRGRRMLSGMVQFKKSNISGAGNAPNTRLRALNDNIQSRIQRAANTYHSAYTALLALQPDGPWKSHFQQLNPTDIRGPGRQSNDPTEKSKGKYELSWIWSVGKVTKSDDSDEEELDGVMRVEWAKAKARQDRWDEEYHLLQEEMRRTVAYLEWKVRWWRNQAIRRVTDDAPLAQGLYAYTGRQAYLLDTLAHSCVTKWVPLLKEHGADISWAAKYEISATGEAGVVESDSDEEKEREDIGEDLDG
jgi:hypothetical protein